MTAGVRRKQAVRSARLSNEGVNPGRSAFIKVKGRLQESARRSPLGLWGGSVSCDRNHHAPAREEPEKVAEESPSAP